MIDATHIPQSGVTVSAYKDPGSTKLIIVATNQNSTSASQTFTVTNSSAISAMTPYTTSSSLSMAQQSNVSLSSNSFTYSLPAYSVTTFVSPAQAVAPSCTPATATYSSGQSVTCTNSNSGTTVMCYNTAGAPATNGSGTGCTTGTQYTGAISVASTETLYIIAGTSILADSVVTSNAYNIGSVTLSPTQQIFSTVNVGQSGTPYTFTLTNTGISSMTGLTLTVPPNYTISTTTCGSTLTVSASCTVNVEFTPLAPAYYLQGLLTATYSGGDSASPQYSFLDGAATATTLPYNVFPSNKGMILTARKPPLE